MVKNKDNNSMMGSNSEDEPLSQEATQQLFSRLSTTLKLEEKLVGAELLQEVTRLIEQEDNELALEILNAAKKNLAKKLKTLGCFLMIGIIITGIMIFVFNSTLAYAVTIPYNKNLRLPLIDDGDNDDDDNKKSNNGMVTVMGKSIRYMTFLSHTIHNCKSKAIFHMKARITVTELTENIDPRLLIFQLMPLYLNSCSSI